MLDEFGALHYPEVERFIVQSIERRETEKDRYVKALLEAFLRSNKCTLDQVRIVEQHDYPNVYFYFELKNEMEGSCLLQ